MRKLLTSPANMALNSTDAAIYQNILNQATELSLNLMAVKVDTYPQDFLSWCQELLSLALNKLNYDLLDEAQHVPLKKMLKALEQGINSSQLRMLAIAPWPIYLGFIEANANKQVITERLELLRYIKSLKELSLSQMSELDRLCISGKHTASHCIENYPFDVEWFSSTKGSKPFQSLVINSPQLLDSALSHIPLTGDVTSEHYQAFVQDYQAAFTSINENATLAPATRLLAMRRPDTFVALNSAKLEAICLGFNVVKVSNKDFDGYWWQIIKTVHNAPWYKEPEPDSSHVDEPLSSNQDMAEPLEHNELWNHRALFVDLFFHIGDDAAEQSNFIKLRDKPKSTKAKSSARTRSASKRTKQSAEMLVEQALADEQLPEYLKNHKESLIKQVKDGKSPQQAIDLLRAIFG